MIRERDLLALNWLPWLNDLFESLTAGEFILFVKGAIKGSVTHMESYSISLDGL